jgi:hypothetical protein
MAKVTYERLEETLRSYGFSLRGIYEKNKVFSHEETGALVVYPEFPLDEEVLPRHLLAVRAILNAYGIADPMELAARLLNGR